MVTVREARPEDIPRITAIYGPAVLTGKASFEFEPPAEAEMERRYRAIVEAGYPYFVAERAGVVIGYAYAGPYRARPGYRYSVENSVYVDPKAMRSGAGRALLSRLVEACTERGYRQMIAVIGDSANAASIELHRRLGFRDCGVIKSVGRKHGQWLDSVIMQLPLGDGDTTDPE